MGGPIIIEGPDGQEYEFPAGTPESVMRQAMIKQYGAPKSNARLFGVTVPTEEQYLEKRREGKPERDARARLASMGATMLDSYGAGRSGPILSAPAATFSDRDPASLGKPFERLGAAAIGGADISSLGFSDEAAGLVFGDKAKENARANIKAAQKYHPISYAAGGLPAVAIPGQAIRGANTMQKLGSAALRALPFGAAYGVGSGESAEGRAMGGAIGGATAAAMGGGFVLGGRGLEYAGRKVLGSAELRSLMSKISGGNKSAENIKEIDDAVTQMQRAARVGGQNLDRQAAKQALVQALQKAEPNDFVGDVVPGGPSSMEGAALPGMGGANLLEKAMTQRGEQQSSRVIDAVSKISQGADIEESLANLAKIKTEQASPLYKEAFAPDKTINRNPDSQYVEEISNLDDMLKLDDFKRGIKAGERILKLEQKNPNANFSVLNDFEQIDYIKKGLDSEIGKLIRLGDNQTASALIKSKNEMLDIADKMNPAYAEARRVWAGAQAQEEAILLGESLLGSNGQAVTGAKLRDIKKQFGKFSDAEKTAFSIGLFEKAMTSMGTVNETMLANTAKSGFLSPNTKQTLRQFLPEEQAEDFLNLLTRETRQQMNAARVFGSSRTGQRLNAGDAVRDVTKGLRGEIADFTNPLQKIQRILRGPLENNPNSQRKFAEFLTTRANDPKLLRSLNITPNNAPILPGGPMPGPAPTTFPSGPTQRLSPSSLLDDTPAPGAIARPLSDSLLDETITAPVDDVKAANRYFGRKSFRSENRGGAPIGEPTPQQAKTAAKSLPSLIEDQANTARPGVAARPLSDSLLDETITAPVDDVKAANRYFGRKSFRSENRGAAGLPKKRLSPDDPELGMLATGGEAGQIKSAQRAGYQGEDAGEAKEWVNASLKGLDMSQGARMQRARDMGFDTDTVLYHGTGADFEAFEKKRLGAEGQSVFLTDSSAVANTYAKEKIGQSGGLVMPLHIRGKIKKSGYTRPYPAESATNEEWDKWVHDNNIWDDDIAWRKSEYFNEEISKAKSEGFDGIVFQHISDTKSGRSNFQSNIYAIFDPSNIRSVNAAFDPDNAKSANLLGNVRTGANGVLDSPLPYMAGAGAVGTYGVSEAQKKPRD